MVKRYEVVSSMTAVCAMMTAVGVLSVSTVSAAPLVFNAPAVTSAVTSTVSVPTSVPQVMTTIDPHTQSIIDTLRSYESSTPGLKEQVDSLEKALTDAEAMIPEVTSRVEQATVNADDAYEKFVIAKTDSERLRQDIDQLTQQVEEARHLTHESQGLVSNVARGMYIDGSGTSSEMTIVLSAETPSEATSRIQNVTTVMDTAGSTAEHNKLKEEHLRRTLDDLTAKQRELSEQETLAEAQKKLADDNRVTSQQGALQLQTMINTRTQALQQLSDQTQLRNFNLASSVSSLSGEAAALQQWLSSGSSIPVAEVIPAACPTTSPAGTNRTGRPLNQVCADAVMSAPTLEAKKAIIYAFAHLGAPYSQGNRFSVNPPVFDCSSFVARAYSAAGATIRKNGTAQSWISTFGFTGMYTPGVYEGTNVVRVPASEVRPGDVFIQFDGNDPANSAGNNGHAQMYIGNNTVIQSGGGSDSRVNVSTHYNSFSNEWVFRYIA